MSKFYGIDLGTRALKIYKKGDGIVYDEKNIIAIADESRVIATGDSAFEMLGKAPSNISVTYLNVCYYDSFCHFKQLVRMG